jgi:hypothetical protein
MPKHEIQPALPGAALQPANDMIKVEKNLNYISFFSPSKSKKGRKDPSRAQQVRTITYPAREINGKTVIPKTTIKPDPQLGLPTTADRDKYMAFMKIVTDRKARVGKIENPIGFTTYELLKHLGLTDAGFHYEEVNQFLERMVSTTIKSEYAVYFHGTKRYAKDIFHVFNRVVLTGQEATDGTAAQMNYVYLSDWQLENINANYTFPIDFNSYRRLRRDIAKALFGHLHTWFYASRGKPVERKYSDLCELLDIQCWPHLSKARQILKPSLDELIEVGYFQNWSLVHTVDQSDFKLVMVPGECILQLTRPRLSTVAPSNSVSDPEMDEALRALVDRGIREQDARRALFDIDLDRQHVLDQVEWFDAQVQRMGFSMTNPPGFLLTIIRDNWPIPRSFETTRKRTLQSKLHNNKDEDAAAMADALKQLRRLELEEEYRTWVDGKIEEAIRLKFTEPARQKALKTIRKEILSKHPGLYSGQRHDLGQSPALDHHAEHELRAQICSELQLPSIEAFGSQAQRAMFA